MFVLYLLLSCLLLLLSVCGTVCVCGAARVFIRAPCPRPCSGGEGGVVLGEDEDGGHRVPHVVSLLAHCCRGRVDVVRDSVLRLHLHTHTHLSCKTSHSLFNCTCDLPNKDFFQANNLFKNQCSIWYLGSHGV